MLWEGLCKDWSFWSLLRWKTSKTPVEMIISSFRIWLVFFNKYFWRSELTKIYQLINFKFNLRCLTKQTTGDTLSQLTKLLLILRVSTRWPITYLIITIILNKSSLQVNPSRLCINPLDKRNSFRFLNPNSTKTRRGKQIFKNPTFRPCKATKLF